MRCLHALLAMLLALAISAQDAAQAGPATLTVWNRDITVFRRTVGWNTPSQRVVAAQARIEALPEASWGVPVAVRETDLDGIQGALISIDGHFLFGIAREDLDTQAGETLQAACDERLALINRLTADLQVMRAEMEKVQKHVANLEARG